MSPRPIVPVRHWLKAKCILARWNHRQGYRVTVSARMHVLCFKPRTQPRVIDFRLALPEIRGQSALDPEMIQLQLDRGDFLGEISPHIVCADE
jgi:hypothetical protein